ncbi:MAG: alpha/beta hydrolase [Rhodospirillales bacterium]|nr:alpha/beta hydrolase [Rhodospirillales bacterium]
MPQTSNGVSYHVGGTGDPTLLLVHGFACAGEDWSHQLADLRNEFRCVTLDLPGHGASLPPPAVTLAALGSAVNEVRREAGLGRVILVGHSLGAKIIREAYAEQPADVAGLVLIDGAFYDSDRPTMIARASALIDADGFAAYARKHFAGMFTVGTAPSMKAHIVDRTMRLEPGFGRTLYLEAVGWDSLRGKATLRAIKVPVLVLQSTHLGASLERESLARGMKSDFMKLVERLVPGAETQVIAGVGHFSMLEAPHEVSQALRMFASRTHGREMHG